MKDANALLGRSGTILAVFGRAGDSMRGMYGKKNSEERATLLQGMEILVTRVGQIVAGAAPQVRDDLMITCSGSPATFELTSLVHR